MTPIEFALWMNGAVGVMGDAPPDEAQWARIQERLEQVVGAIVAQKLLQEAEQVARTRQSALDMHAQQAVYVGQIAQYAANRAGTGTVVEYSEPRPDTPSFLGRLMGTATKASGS